MRGSAEGHVLTDAAPFWRVAAFRLAVPVIWEATGVSDLLGHVVVAVFDDTAQAALFAWYDAGAPS